MNQVPNLIKILHSVLSLAARCSKGMPERKETAIPPKLFNHVSLPIIFLTKIGALVYFERSLCLLGIFILL